MRQKVFLFACLLLFTWCDATSGERSHIRGAGMARTAAAFSRGLDAVSVNPANLALPDRGSVTVDVLPLGVHLGSDFANLDLYNTYFTGMDTDSGKAKRYLSHDDKQAILSSFRGNVAQTFADLDASLLGISFTVSKLGSFALTITDRLKMSADLSRDYLEFLLYGNPQNSRYDFHETYLAAVWRREYAVSFASAVPRVPTLRWMAIGGTVKLIHGFAYYELERFNTSVATSEQGVITAHMDIMSKSSLSEQFTGASDGGFILFPSPAGSGIGLDIGIAAGLSEYLSMGISLTDLGTVDWGERVREFRVDTVLQLDDPQTLFLEENIKEIGRNIPTDGFSTQLPARIRVGAELDLHKLWTACPGELLIGVDYHHGLVEGPEGPATARISMGVEYKPLEWLPLRSGVSFEDREGMSVAIGLGFWTKVLDIDIATENIGWLMTQRGPMRGSIAFGMRLRF